MPTITYQRYLKDAPQEVARRTGENYERYFVPSIGVPFARPVVAAAGLHPGDRVLDVACGTGVAARLAAERVGPTGRVAGVDPTPPMLEAARATSPDVDWHQGVAEDLPFEDGSFDAIVCSLGFQFFSDQVRALGEMRRVLVPGGRVAIGTPGPTPPLMAALEGALADHVGEEAAGFVQAVFSVHDPAEVRRAFDAAGGYRDVEAGTQPLPLRVAPPADFLWQYVCCTPLAGAVAQLSEDTRAALERDVVERCRPYLDGDSLVMEPGLLVASAHRI